MPAPVTRTAAALAAIAVLGALGAGTAMGATLAPNTGGGTGPTAAPTVGGEAAAPGCTIQCITQASVEATASQATVVVRTTVPAAISVSVTPAGAPIGEAAGPGAGGPPVNAVLTPLTQRTVVFTDLQPDTLYRIVVRARDAAGKESVRVGEFRTRAVEVAVDPPAPPALDSGAGCAANCITQASAMNSATVVGRTRLDVRTSEPARITLHVRLKGPGPKPVRVIRSTGAVTRFAPLLGGLQAGSDYSVVAEARDAEGRVQRRVGQFRTARARAVVSIAKVLVIDDGDRGPNRGELSFTYRIDGKIFGGGFVRRSSGDVFSPGVSAVVPADGNPNITVSVRGDECDDVRMATCVIEVQGDSPPVHSWAQGGGSAASNDEFAWIRGTWTLNSLRKPGALPGWSGTGLGAPPAGAEAATFIQTTSHQLKFRAGIAVDLQVVS